MDMSLKGILCKSADFSDPEINPPIRFSCSKDNRTTEAVEEQNPPEITMRSNTTTRRQAAKQIETRCAA
jgi:hypothetical protein